MPDVLVTEQVVGSEMEVLKQGFEVIVDPDLWKSSERLEEMIPEFQALIVRNQTKVSEGLIRRGRNLRVIGRAGAGLDNIDVAAATRAGIVVTYAPEQNSISVVELTFGMMLSLARKIGPADRSTKSGAWNRREFMGVELYGKTLGIVGLGRIGSRIAMRARAFGMEVVACDSYANADALIPSELGVTLTDLDTLLVRADFVSCHIPLTEQTHDLFNDEKFSLMRPTAFFINTSRGEVVDEDALARALEEKKLAGAALDVRSQEPPGRGLFHDLDNVILTPHIGAFTAEAQERVVSSVCRDVANILSGKEAMNYFNFPKPKKNGKYESGKKEDGNDSVTGT